MNIKKYDEVYKDYPNGILRNNDFRGLLITKVLKEIKNAMKVNYVDNHDDSKKSR